MTAQEQEMMKREEQAVSGEARRVDRRPVYSPATDVYEQEGSFVLVMDMPGVTDKDVELQLEDDVLNIRAGIKEQELEGYELLYGEFRPADYERSFTLSSDIDRDKIKASVKNGVLRVELPKTEKLKPRKIEVKAG